MASDDLIELEGEVIKVHTGGKFEVQVPARDPAEIEAEGKKVHKVMAHLAGRLRRFRIRVVLGDKVTVAVSPYDVSKGRIVYRHK